MKVKITVLTGGYGAKKKKNWSVITQCDVVILWEKKTISEQHISLD